MKKMISCLTCGKKRSSYKPGNFCSRVCYYKGLKNHLIKTWRHKGWHHSKAAIKKISESGKKRTGMKFSDEHKKNMSITRLGIRGRKSFTGF